MRSIDHVPPAIAVNGASFPQRVTGVQRYARELALRLLQEPDVRLILPSPVDDFTPGPSAVVDVAKAPVWLQGLGEWGWLDTGLRRELAEDEVLWSPTIRAPLWARRHVLTVHDLAVFDHPEWFSRAVVAQWRLMLPILKRRCAHLVTDSEFSRQRLLDRLDLDESAVTVVPCGVDERFGSTDPSAVDLVRDRLDLPERFVLAIGSVDPRKNLGLLLDSWRRSHIGSDVGLVLAGGAASTFADDPAFASLPAGVRHLGYVPDADLPHLYAAAEVFVFPSMYEGFGLPPLEAMAAGTPVIGLASTQAVAEVVGSAGLLVPGRPEHLADALSFLMGDESARGELIQAGRARAQGYSWEVAAGRLRRVLIDVERGM